MAAGSELTPDGTPRDETARIEAGDREPIHGPGSIQPHGLLLIAERAGGKVVGGAGAIEDRLTPSWLGRPLSALLAQPIDLAAAQAEAAPGTIVPLAAVPGRREAFTATLHVSGVHLLVELEPQPEFPISAGWILSRLDAIGAGFARAGDLQALCDRAAIGFRSLTGFDRVMICRFLDDGAGMVVAEDRDRSRTSLLNHHFPAADIPRQTQLLYLRNIVRVIPDVAYAPAPIRSDKEELRGVDLSDAVLRGVSPAHLQRLRAMGVTASTSIAIVRDGLLWGLVACHHMKPRGLSYEVRAACRALAGALAREIGAGEEAESRRARIRLRQAEDAMIGRFDADAPFGRFFRDMAEDMRRMFDADGFAAVQGPNVCIAGIIPEPADLKELVRWLGPRTAIEPFATAALGERFEPAAAYPERASGVLAVCLTTEVSTLMMWFRAETPTADPEPGPIPRGSIEAVRGRSRRWTMSEVEAANHLRRVLFDLRQSRRLRDLNRELAATVAEKDALAAEKEHLLGAVDHRVLNSLQLAREFLALQARDESPAVAASLAKAQQRLSALALVHSGLSQAGRESVDLARYLDDVAGDMRAAMGGEWRNAITTSFAPVAVAADRAVPIGLILTELVTNAHNHAYGGRPGPIAITLEPHRGQLRLIVADQGGGPQREAEAFGTRMIRAMAERLGGTIERQDNRPGLRVTLTAPV